MQKRAKEMASISDWSDNQITNASTTIEIIKQQPGYQI